MADTFQGTIAACAGDPSNDGASHEPEWVWTVALGDPSVYGGMLEFIEKHIGCATFVAKSFAGEFDDFELASKTLATAP